MMLEEKYLNSFALKSKKLIEQKEDLYFLLLIFFAIPLFLLLLITIIGFIYFLMFAIFFFFIQGIAIGHVKQNAVKVTEKQFPDVHNRVQEYCLKLNLPKYPSVYIQQAGGMLNAFATRFLLKDFVVIYSDVLEMAYEQGEDAVNFIIAHELAHVQRKHMAKKPFIILGEFIPFLGVAYSRACETTCDNIATYLVPNNPTSGLLALLAGKDLYKKVDMAVFINEANKEGGFWTWFAEITSTHPNLSKRLERIIKLSFALNKQQSS